MSGERALGGCAVRLMAMTLCFGVQLRTRRAMLNAQSASGSELRRRVKAKARPAPGEPRHSQLVPAAPPKFPARRSPATTAAGCDALYFKNRVRPAGCWLLVQRGYEPHALSVCICMSSWRSVLLAVRAGRPQSQPQRNRWRDCSAVVCDDTAGPGSAAKSTALGGLVKHFKVRNPAGPTRPRDARSFLPALGDVERGSRGGSLVATDLPKSLPKRLRCMTSTSAGFEHPDQASRSLSNNGFRTTFPLCLHIAPSQTGTLGTSTS